jgi:hypothetical protein
MAGGPATSAGAAPGTRDLQRTFQLLLASLWLFDAVLQLQPSMFVGGAQGLSGLLAGTAAGNPAWAARSITWAAAEVAHHSVAANIAFVTVQAAIAVGIAVRRTTKVALAGSVVWSLAIWWFGEGAGGVLHGAGTPLGGGPGGVLFYALVAILLWPRAGDDRPFVAARGIGERAATVVWVAWWLLLALLAVLGGARNSAALRQLATSMMPGEPGWLAGIERGSAAVLGSHGLIVALSLSLGCIVVASSIALPIAARRVVLAVAMVAFVLIWLGVEDMGGILAGGATDPNSGPPAILLLALYWPLRSVPVSMTPATSDEVVSS